MPRPKRATPAQRPLRKLWNEQDAPLPTSPEERAAPLLEADLVRIFRKLVRKLVPGDWVAYELYPMPGVRQDLNRPPVASDDTLAIMAYRPVNGEEPLLFIPLTDSLRVSHLEDYRGYIEAIQKWFYKEFPPVNEVRLEKFHLQKMIGDSGMGYDALARHLNDSASQMIKEVVRGMKGIPPRRLNPEKLKNRLAAFGYGQKVETIIEDAIAKCRRGYRPFMPGLPFQVDRVKDYLCRWKDNDSPS